MSEGRKPYAVSGATKTRSALCGLTLELTRRAGRWDLRERLDGRVERIVRPQRSHDAEYIDRTAACNKSFL
jgi:hypothetical protein